MNSTRRIGLLLALAFLLPALFFSVYEISSLNRDEKMIQGIYEKQLEAILFSVNQYCDDIVSRWISKIENGLENSPPDHSNPPAIQNLFSLNSSLACIFVSDTIATSPLQAIFLPEPQKDNQLRVKYDSARINGRAQIQKLASYMKSGFQKVDVLQFNLSQSTRLQCLMFISNAGSSHPRLVGILVDPEVFVQDLVGPRLQVIARDQFILSAYDKKISTAIYSTTRTDSVAAESEALTKDFWLFPDFSLGIRTKGSSLQQVIRERTNTNLGLLIMLDAVLIVAVVLVFRNVRKEVQLAQNKSDFVSNVSHEIRTPLALISMFAETLEMGRVKSEEKKQEYYSIISKETHRLSAIVNKILNFSQTEANKKTLHVESIHLGNEIKAILNTYDFHLKNKGFDYSYNESREVHVLADKEAFVEILINLIDNAMKYSADQKQIEIAVDSDSTYGIIVVKDHGVGISAMDQKHIFDKFYRVSSGDLARSRGTGLGLSLVKQLMDAHNGKITVHSQPERGSSFTLYFPKANA